MAIQPEPQPAPPAPVQWEYRVVHIDVEPGNPPEPPDPKTASEHLHGTLSPDFLAREFPEIYGDESDTARRSRHPAEQLQTFLNLLGRQGWEMTDTSQVGPLLMFFFKRPLRPTPKLIAAVRRKGDAAGSPRDAQPEQPS